jgi:hypothetical protein
VSVSAATLAFHEQLSIPAAGARNKFDEVPWTTEDATTKHLAEGLPELAEAVQGLGAEVERMERHTKPS